MNDYERAKKKVLEQRGCMPSYVCCVGARGPQGPLFECSEDIFSLFPLFIKVCWIPDSSLFFNLKDKYFIKV